MGFYLQNTYPQQLGHATAFQFVANDSGIACMFTVSIFYLQVFLSATDS